MSARRRISVLVIAAAVLAAICAPLAIGAQDDLILVSRASAWSASLC